LKKEVCSHTYDHEGVFTFAPIWQIQLTFTSAPIWQIQLTSNNTGIKEKSW